ncbi:MAG: two-component sensor histidine kinase [Arcobacter sp.]|nr:MAG: two-component sensor histidine kinase [Arcobacter sp.]
MIVDERKFVRRYSLIYTFIISFILLAPLSIYVNHELNVQEIKTEIELKSIQANIIGSMGTFGNNPNKVFEFPKFTSYESGLYTKDYSIIYTQIKEPLPSFMRGYHSQGLSRFLITKIPSEKYFFADYIITRTTISYSSVLLQVSFIAFGIIALILFLSFYFLNSFSMPFKRVNEKLDDFIQESMHEMNTPLSIINVNVDLFDSKYGKNKYFNRIKSATKSLATIYNDMDYLIKENRVDYKDELISLEAFIQERIEYFELICQLKNIELSLYAPTKTVIIFNPTKLQRIIDNTLSNAIKFSDKDGRIEVRIQETEEGGISLSFQDYGQGIKNPEKIMGRYYRENEYKNGFGIGMSIVKSIIDEAGITLHVKSKLSEGSTFIYIIKASLLYKEDAK